MAKLAQGARPTPLAQAARSRDEIRIATPGSA